jgi:HlyD family secretion protein
MKNPSLALTLALVLSVSALTGCGPRGGQAPAGGAAGAAAAEDKSVPVRTAPAREETVARTIPVTGSVAATQTVALAPKLSGRVTFVAGREGQPVRRGAVVLRQDVSDYITQVQSARAQVESAQANLASAQSRLAQAQTQAKLQVTSSSAGVQDARQQLASARAALELAQRPQRTQEINVAENAVAQAQANYDKAVLDRQRYEGLVKEGAAAQSLLDQYVTQERVAQASLNSSKEQLEIARIGGREASIRQAQVVVQRAETNLRLAQSNTQQNQLRQDEIKAAQSAVAQNQAAVAQAQAALAQAQLQVDNGTLMAPIDGIISQRSAEPGQLIGPTASALTIVALGTVFFEAQVPETEVGRIRAGQSVRVAIDAYPGKSFTGTIARLYPTASTSNRVFIARISLANESRALRPGMFARGEIVVEQRRGIVVPKDALVTTEDGKFAVFVADGKTAHRKVVTVGIQTDTVSEVRSGVTAGESIIVIGQNGLSDGAAIRPAS